MSAMAAAVPANIHGRRAGRGLRPWLLVPKVLAVGCLFGGLVSALLLLTVARPSPQDTAAWAHWLNVISILFRYLVVPASLAVVSFGLLLTLQAPRILLAQRWLQVKLLLLVTTLPPLHFLARYRFHQLRQADPALTPPSSAPQPTCGVLACVITAVIVVAILVTLSRVKPRLGQNWAQTYMRLRSRKAALSKQ